MRLLILLALLDYARSAPRSPRQAAPVELANNAPALNAVQDHFGRHALFIPRGQEPEGFDPSKPIQGAFFMSGDAEPFNHPPFRLSQPVPLANRAVVALPQAEGTESSAVEATAALAPAPLAPNVVPLETIPEPSHSPRMAFTLAPAIEQLITTTQNTSALPVVELSTVSTGSPQPLPAANPNTAPVDKSIDLDGDGRLNLSEVQYAAFVHHGLSGTVVQGMFNEVDRNKDGFLDSEEFNDIRALVLAKAENAALRYMQSVDTDKNKMLSLEEAQAYILKEHGIGSRDVERVWRLVVPDTTVEMDAVQFSKLRRRIRGMTIRLARQIMKVADTNADGHISLEEAQAIAFEQEGIGAGDVSQMFASVDDNNDGELNAPEFADFERIVRARAVETSKKALRVVDIDASNTLTMDEARRIAFEHYGFDEDVLTPFFDQADENEDGHLDAVEFAGFRSVIRSKAVRNAVAVLKEIDLDGDGFVSLPEAEEKTRREDDMDEHETAALFNIADQNKSGKLDKVELADFIRLVRLSAIRFATDHFKEFDTNRDRLVTVDELAQLIENKYHVPFEVTKEFFAKVDVDASGDLIPAEIVDFRHEIRKYVAQHPTTSAAEREQQQNDRESVESEEEETTTTRRTTTTTTAPTTTTTASTTTTSTTTLPPSTTTHRRRFTTSTTPAPRQSVSTTFTLAVTAAFPTLLPTTRRKVPFRKHTTLIPQTNDIEDLVSDITASEVKVHPEINFAADVEEENSEKPTTRVSQVWKKQRHTTVYSSPTTSTAVTLAPTSTLTPSPPLPPYRVRANIRTGASASTASPLTNTASTSAAENERKISPVSKQTTVTTRKTTPRSSPSPTTEALTSTDLMTTTARPRTRKPHSTSTARTTIAPWSTTEEVEYEIVEVEVDEDGNEIVADKGRSAEQQQPTTADRKAPKQALEVVEEVERQAERPRQELEGRKRLVEAQKRQLHLPPGTEVEYVDAETTKRPDDYDEYEDEKVERS